MDALDRPATLARLHALRDTEVRHDEAFRAAVAVASAPPGPEAWATCVLRGGGALGTALVCAGFRLPVTAR